MRNKQINGLTTDHSPTPLLKQEQMLALDVEEMESSCKMDLRDVSWWKSIKDACRLGVRVIVRHSKERCISLVAGGKPSCAACKQD